MRELEKRGIAYNLIDSGQHAEWQEKFCSSLGIHKPDIMIRAGCRDITTPFVLIQWFINEYIKSIFFVKNTRERFFKNEGGICLIHGDTPTTLLSALIAMRCRIKIVHLEAGLRSYSLISPFPEELIRIIVMKIADVLFTSSKWAYNNLKRMHVKGKIVSISANTGLDSLRYSISKHSSDTLPMKNYCVISIHRFERLAQRKGLKELVELVERIAREKKVFFPVHPPTKRFLQQYGLMKKIHSLNNVISSDLYDHSKFLYLIKDADFIITDGGSIQEESYYLGVPCFILRSHTERQEGLGYNAVLAKKWANDIDNFLLNYRKFRKNSIVNSEFSPSSEIVDYLIRYNV